MGCGLGPVGLCWSLCAVYTLSRESYIPSGNKMIIGTFQSMLRQPPAAFRPCSGHSWIRAIFFCLFCLWWRVAWCQLLWGTSKMWFFPLPILCFPLGAKNFLIWAVDLVWFISLFPSSAPFVSVDKRKEISYLTCEFYRSIHLSFSLLPISTNSIWVESDIAERCQPLPQSMI